jgi:hypothetical protein
MALITLGAGSSQAALTSLEPPKSADEEKLVERNLQILEHKWNEHDLEGVMRHYADDYVNNDGLDKKSVSELTKDLWKNYPDAKSTSKMGKIRVEGRFATVDSHDTATGYTAKELPAVGGKGELSSVSEGQLFLKKVGDEWKIIGDRIDYERVRVAFGMARNLKATFTAPEQVKAGQEYSARLLVQVPPELLAVGSITSEPLQYPQVTHTEVWRQIDEDSQTIERVIRANASNHNELLMATIGITGMGETERMKLKGLTYITRRMNVVPLNTPVTKPNSKSAEVDSKKMPAITPDINDETLE